MPTGHFWSFLESRDRLRHYYRSVFPWRIYFFARVSRRFSKFSRGLNHPETCAGAFIRSALVLFTLLPLLEHGASLTSTTKNRIICFRTLPAVLPRRFTLKSTSWLPVYYPDVCCGVGVCGSAASNVGLTFSSRHWRKRILPSWRLGVGLQQQLQGSCARARRIQNARCRNHLRMVRGGATIFRRSGWLVCVWS